MYSPIILLHTSTYVCRYVSIYIVFCILQLHYYVVLELRTYYPVVSLATYYIKPRAWTVNTVTQLLIFVSMLTSYLPSLFTNRNWLFYYKHHINLQSIAVTWVLLLNNFNYYQRRLLLFLQIHPVKTYIP